MTSLRSCVGKDGQFIVGVHQPEFDVQNFRDNEHLTLLGRLENGERIDNQINFPMGNLHEPKADIIYEVANAFPFRGTSYINSAWADQKAKNIDSIRIPEPPSCSLIKNCKSAFGKPPEGSHDNSKIIDLLPHPLLIALAQASTDPEELILLAKKSCHILFDPETRTPIGLGFKKTDKGTTIPEVFDHELFEVLVNNPHLPDGYKNTLVLKPGVQGTNEITGEYQSDNQSGNKGNDGKTHVFEYLRRNSYIPWGHFASNMANDAIRYSAKELSFEDMTGIRHLYYQRTYARIASYLGIDVSDKKKCLTPDKLENLRKQIHGVLKDKSNNNLTFDATLWGWNFGFGYAQSGHRLHASHQMIHQQNALIPKHVQSSTGQLFSSFACGDLIAEFVDKYQENTDHSFFQDYIKAINNNTRTDGNYIGESSLIIAEDDQALLFVPKAQISEWELQLIPKIPCGNILEADSDMRASLDKFILLAVQTLESLGAKLITSIEFSKRINSTQQNQHLLYSFIPRLPYAPDTFSEAQLRWITGCYPEDVAHACRMAIKTWNQGRRADDFT